MPVEYEDGTKGYDPGRAHPRGRVGVGREQGRHPGGGSEGSRSGSSTATRCRRARSCRSRRATSSPRATTSAGRRSSTPGTRTTTRASSRPTASCAGRTWCRASRSARSWTRAPASGRIVVMADPDRELHPSVLVYMPNRKDPQEYTLAEGSRVILGSPTDQVSRAMEIPDAANPWSTKFHVDERPINEAWPSKTKKESEGQDGLPEPAGQGDQGHHGHQDPAAGVQDPRHHGRSARASRSCSRRGGRRIRPPSPRWTAW